MLRSLIQGLLIFAICAAPPTAYAWAKGENFDIEMSCKELSALNADKIIVRVTPTDGSFGLPFLVGLKDEQVLWSRPFPNAEEINVAKYEATCKGKKIILTFQFPARQPYVIQEYKWNGKNLVLIKRWVKQ
jgi:hypothetical protein